MREKIAVIGAGNGGFAMAADLALDGYKVNLFEFPKFKSNINSVIETGGVEISGPIKTGFSRLNLVTTDLEKAITKCSFIMIVTQANAQDTLADMFVPIIKPGQTIFLLPGSAGTLLMAKKFREQRVSSEVRLAETVTLPYICRKIGQNKVHVERRTGNLGIGTFPGEDIDDIFSVFQTMYPDSYKMQNVLEVGLCNTNFIAHPAPAIMSLSQIEFGKGNFNFYKDGCSPSVEKVITAVNSEIAGILDVLKFKTISPMAACEKRFGMTWDEIQEMRKKWDIRVNFDTDKRFFTEDVQVGLVLISSLGKQFEVPTPVCDSIIHLSGIVEETDFWGIGRTAKMLGLHKMNIEELNDFLQHGYR
ncbi:MAG: hypothetical protein HKP41_06740 [Desulfobacterales bacterium]|nr:NAD/NADP octopine/nopaline dehydrogenase family protein [Deltaproteobacteria bacterium]MBT8361004.1 NAD/NADP octopine/nopaline dehydrogenase family protein [Deltaproteobacteria bacterium]NNK94031.1 hypothetical protein [Desulfobacterales bacterium]